MTAFGRGYRKLASAPIGGIDDERINRVPYRTSRHSTLLIFDRINKNPFLVVRFDNPRSQWHIAYGHTKTSHSWLEETA